jgi:hypothetical protein
LFTTTSPTLSRKTLNNNEVVSDSGWKPTLKVSLPPPPMNPNTMIKINGNSTLNTIAEGLLSSEVKLAFVMANMALTWL